MNYSYPLQSVQLPSGLYAFTLWTDLASLQVPEFASLAIVGGTRERADTQPLVYEVEQLTLEYSEDYSYYTQEGFWFTVLSSPCEIQITCDGEHFFWGMPVDPISDIKELSLVAYHPNRQGTFTIASLLTKAKSVQTHDVVNYALDQTQEVDSRAPGNPATTNAMFVSYLSLFSSILAYVFSQTYDEDNVEIVGDLSDFRTTISGNDYYIHEALWYVGYVHQVSRDFTPVGFFPWSQNVDQPEYAFDGLYPFAYDWLWELSKHCGVYPVHYYDTTNAVHKLRLMTRRSMGIQYITNQAPTESSVVLTAYPINNVVSSGRIGRGTRTDERYMIGGEECTGSDPLSRDSLTVDRLIVYSDNEKTWDSATGWLWLWLLIGGTPTRITEFKYWKYGTGDFATADSPWVAYWYYRYEQNLRGLQRTYPTLLSTNGYTGSVSQANNHVFALMQDNDGITTRTYFAAEVFKDPFAEELSITWFQL